MWEAFKKKGADEFSGTSMSLRCYESHPVLKLGKGKLVGGSASHPAIKNADIYVSLQSGSTSGYSSDPWEAKNPIIEVHFSIRDMEAPSNVPRFKKMITWLCNQLHDGKTVHVGCIGGHGRTGTVVSAIVAEIKDEKDAIQWVRKHYCKKAVESKEQVKFLMKHYNVSGVEPTKTFEPSNFSTTGAWSSRSSKADDVEWTNADAAQLPLKRTLPEGVSGKSKSYAPMSSARSLWRKKK